MSLTELPTELLTQVCEFFDKPAHRNFSLVDKRCHSVAVPLLFQAICINPTQAAEFQEF